jgi:glyoxylase-like metal-dependent hydrolase (beta-lactamase superfamily II)
MSGQDSIEYPFAEPPAPGATLEVAPGLHWLRMPLPFELDHINLWLLEDQHEGEPAWTLIDTGLGDEATREIWQQLLGARLRDRPLKRVLVTHYHPDHAGSAAWLCERLDARLWMTRGEYLTVHAARAGSAGYSTAALGSRSAGGAVPAPPGREPDLLRPRRGDRSPALSPLRGTPRAHGGRRRHSALRARRDEAARHCLTGG